MTAPTCPATVFVRPGGTFTCTLAAGHESMHEARLSGQWETVLWSNDGEYVPAPGSWRGRPA